MNTDHDVEGHIIRVKSAPTTDADDVEGHAAKVKI